MPATYGAIRFTTQLSPLCMPLVFLGQVACGMSKFFEFDKPHTFSHTCRGTVLVVVNNWVSLAVRYGVRFMRASFTFIITGPLCKLTGGGRGAGRVAEGGEAR